MKQRMKNLALVLAITLCVCGNAPFAASADGAAAVLRITAGDTVVFGSYEQDGDTSNGAEPIQWLVLDVRDESDLNGAGVLLISQYELAYKEFHDRDELATWETSDLRTWLNDSFLKNAFTDQERTFIAQTDVSTPGNDESYWESGEKKQANVFGGNDTRDDVFVLSYEEAERYFYFGSTDEYAAMGYRLTAPSYAAFVDAAVNHYYDYTMEEMPTKAEYDAITAALPQLNRLEGAWEIELPTLDQYASFWNADHTLDDYALERFWWLRTPGNEAGEFCFVYEDGSVDHGGGYRTSPLFVRPALWLSADAFANAEIAAKAMPVSPNPQTDEALTGTWKGKTDDGQTVYIRFDADGYHLMTAVLQYGEYETFPGIFEASGGKLRVMQIGYQGDESTGEYSLSAPDALSMMGVALSRVDDAEFPDAGEAVLEIDME